ncbi:ISAs1 family transposase [Clostridium grantii]|uniref:Predicted transposase YbfD/YdcC associated with H repeats n=1 Tax=Clostridium grantii DSM 8605 TaxID=1121316 RepID=A0A1M5XP45_9CLOT|nr:ISAs1 family transposase [Clostridium grantii]SHI01519.1 Predicted transposase YbfD/YdcC associated with H repeats [Clostridium grantii DSM 8605]
MSNKESIFFNYFGVIKDMRQQAKVRHKLIDILFIAVAATIANASDWDEVEIFAKKREEWFRKFLELPNGIPSHDTFERVFRWIDPKQFEKCFVYWVREIATLADRSVVAIDGKTMRGAFDTDDKKSPVHIVSAWASENGMVLGQVKTDEKSNEITAISELLDLLFVKNCIIMIDAMGTQTKIAEKIVDKKADYVLALKGNQHNLHQDVVDFFEDAEKTNFDGFKVKSSITSDKGHGRIEVRKYYLVEDIEWLSMKNNWKGLKSIGMAIRECEIKGKKTIERRYFISSLKDSIDEFSSAVRKHWGIESTHWVLDVVFKEDARRVRKDCGPQNLAMLKRMALNIIRKDTTEPKYSLKSKRFAASVDNDYLEQVLIKNFI